MLVGFDVTRKCSRQYLQILGGWPRQTEAGTFAAPKRRYTHGGIQLFLGKTTINLN